MILYRDYVVIDGKTLDVELELDAERLQSHLQVLFREALAKAARRGSYKATKLNRAMILRAKVVTFKIHDGESTDGGD